MKRWIGRWLMGVAVVHTIFAVVVFRKDLGAIIGRGVFDTVGNDPRTGAVVWFLLFGLVLYIAGIAISALERASPRSLPVSIGWSVLALATLGVILMPASGFWLAFPPAVAILLARSNREVPAT